MLSPLLITLIISSCAHKTYNEDLEGPESLAVSTHPTDDEIRSAFNDFNYKLDYSMYETQNVQCFNLKDICYLYARGDCSVRGTLSKTCAKSAESVCWAKHETCIITNHKRWKIIQKAKGYK